MSDSPNMTSFPTVIQYPGNGDLTFRSVIAGTVTYYGFAVAGEATSAATWKVFKVTDDGTTTVKLWADGDTSFDNVWDDYASLSYS